MSPAHVLEPACRRIKRQIMEGAWPPGERLEALRLADDLGVSMTPVRDCLNRLVGERLVEMKPGDGYRVPRISETILRDLLGVNEMLLDHALDAQAVSPKSNAFEPANEDYADRVASIFEFVASRCGNIILVEIVRSISERMHIVRRLEPGSIGGSSKRIERLEQLASGDVAAFRAEMHDYHRSCSDHVATLIRSMS